MTNTPKYLTTEAYWSNMWVQTTSAASRFRQYDPAVADLADCIDALVDQLLATKSEIRVLEVGCANSQWLPYLAHRSHVSVYGLDYSRIGCTQAQQQLLQQDVPGNIICCDFFEFADNCNNSFDLIISFGFIEHFTDPSIPLRQMHQMTTPGGIVLATVPNIKGVYGTIQQIIGGEILNEHIPMDHRDISNFFNESSLQDVSSGYVGGALYLSVVNYHAVQSKILRRMYPVIARVARGIDLSIGLLLRKAGLSINNSLTSPYVYAVGHKN